MTVDGNAKEGIDYLKTVGTFTLPAGQKNGLVVVPVINDKRNLLGEKYFYLAIDSKTIPLFRPKAKGTIIDNDPPESPLQKTKPKATILPKGERHEKR